MQKGVGKTGLCEKPSVPAAIGALLIVVGSATGDHDDGFIGGSLVCANTADHFEAIEWTGDADIGHDHIGNVSASAVSSISTLWNFNISNNSAYRRKSSCRTASPAT